MKTLNSHSVWIEIAFNGRHSTGVSVIEFEITDKKLIDDIYADVFMALDFLDDYGIDAYSVENYEVFDRSFIDRLALLIHQSKITERESKSFLQAIDNVKQYIWNFSSSDRITFCMEIWSIKLNSFNDGANFALQSITSHVDNALEPTDVSIKLSELKNKKKITN